MKIFIFCDMEGVSGICGGEFIHGKFTELGGRLMAEEINACVAGCFDAGALRVIVRDGHGSGVNFDPTLVDPRAELIQGRTPGVRFPEIDGAAGLILLGYHAMAGTIAAVLEHTYNSKSIQNRWLNGRKAGEIGIDAAIAAEHGVSVILVTGDDKACREAEEWIPGVSTCVVKHGYDTQGARLIAPSAARAAVRQSAAGAIKNRDRVKPVSVDYPAVLRIEYIERQAPPNAEALGTRVDGQDGRIYEQSGPSVEKLLLG